jgi:hypothetical protein
VPDSLKLGLCLQRSGPCLRPSNPALLHQSPETTVLVGEASIPSHIAVGKGWTQPFSDFAMKLEHVSEIGEWVLIRDDL